MLGVDRASLLAHPEAPVGTGQIEAFEIALARRVRGEPVAYIRGLKEFYGLALTVDTRALIPRPETELLVDLGLQRLRSLLTEAPRPELSPPLRVWDVGTGSGAVAVALAVEARRRGYGRDVRLLASDTSAQALGLAVENAVVHGVADVIEFRQADLLEEPIDGPVELVLANLPYIPSADVPRLPVAASFEPAAALDGGPDGLDHIRRLLSRLPAVLAPAGACLLEIGADQGEQVGEVVSGVLTGWSLSSHKDLAGVPRVVELRPPSLSAGGDR